MNETSSNASLLTNENSDRLIESGLDRIRISIEHISNEDYKEITQSNITFDEIRQNVEYLFNEKERRHSKLKVHVKIVGLENEKDRTFFKQMLNPISDTIHIETLVGWSHAELADFTLGRKIVTGMDSKSQLKFDRKICNLPFRTISINWNGKVSICCVDWAWDTIIGDVAKESIEQIWNGEKMHNFRKIHVAGKRELLPACKNCHYLYGLNALDEIDGFEDKLNDIYGF